jgi:hypothetical protein
MMSKQIWERGAYIPLVRLKAIWHELLFGSGPSYINVDDPHRGRFDGDR